MSSTKDQPATPPDRLWALVGNDGRVMIDKETRTVFAYLEDEPELNKKRDIEYVRATTATADKCAECGHDNYRSLNGTCKALIGTRDDLTGYMQRIKDCGCSNEYHSGPQSPPHSLSDRAYVLMCCDDLRTLLETHVCKIKNTATVDDEARARELVSQWEAEYDAISIEDRQKLNFEQFVISRIAVALAQSRADTTVCDHVWNWHDEESAAKQIVAQIAESDCLTCKHWSGDAVFSLAQALVKIRTDVVATIEAKRDELRQGIGVVSDGATTCEEIIAALKGEKVDG